MSSYCPDCGSRACNKGICSNCQEELYIMEFQDEEGDYPFSDGFREEAERQRDYLRDRGE
jgi:hypothetical protein